MKNLFSILILLVLVSCSSKTDKKNNSIIGMESSNRNFKDIPQLKKFVKVNDTTIYENNLENKYGILHLKNESKNLVIFKGILTDSLDNVTYKILDTLSISNLKKPEFITINYCNLKNDNEANIIAIVDKADSLKIKNIKKVWIANTTSEKIELENNLNGIDCFNEFFTK
ncbi:hypothetical protein QWY81_03505 [Polaribacter undariae]|uniref:Lipoprotein n=1 Tax=Polaribacter sejongensis TaxID=985043 RepID=A0AAJ1VGN2_9FLAO|nr:hypothetical protein [Polaribacter undariae]MDN3618522.1 hypothetical protein [Polaribacter undariae]UWD30497.1 hypothetical protein NQP51_10130 [Polaribacter undariae]